MKTLLIFIISSLFSVSSFAAKQCLWGGESYPPEHEMCSGAVGMQGVQITCNGSTGSWDRTGSAGSGCAGDGIANQGTFGSAHSQMNNSARPRPQVSKSSKRLKKVKVER